MEKIFPFDAQGVQIHVRGEMTFLTNAILNDGGKLQFSNCNYCLISKLKPCFKKGSPSQIHQTQMSIHFKAGRTDPNSICEKCIVRWSIGA